MESATDTPAPSASPEPPIAPRPSSTLHRAVAFVWLIGIAQCILGTCVCGLFVAVTTISDSQIRDTAGTDHDLADVERTLWLKAHVEANLAMYLGVTAMLTIVPGVSMLVLGWLVSKRRPGAAQFTALVLSTQCILLGILLAFAIAERLMAGDLVSLTLNLVVLGTPLAVMGFAAYLLSLVPREAAAARVPGAEPWNQPDA